MVMQIDHDSVNRPSSRGTVAESYTNHGKMSRKNTTPSLSRHGSGQARARSSPHLRGSRPSTVSKGSGRPMTTASLASSFLTGVESRRELDDDRDDVYEDIVELAYNMSDEGRLSRCLKQWMPDYELRSLPPQPHPPRQAVFSARLGDNMKIKRTSSTESIATQLSLFSTSSHGSNSAALAAAAAKQRRRRRRRLKEMNDEIGGEEQREEGKRSIWVELASKGGGALDKLLRVHAMYHAHMDTETEIFRHLADHEKVMVTEAGTRRWVQLGPGRQRSDSASNVHKKLPKPKPIPLSVQVESHRRAQSAGSKPRGPLTNFRELRRQIVNQRLASLQERFSRHRGSSRRSLTGTRSISRLSPSSMGSNNDVFQSGTPREMVQTSKTIQQVPDKTDGKDEDTPVSVWKGDSQILAIDLQRELTVKVKSKIATTTTALERATGYGDDNNPQTFVGPLEEYPHLVEQDYSFVARIPQRVRISPHLSDVIRADIHVRMGRPRYHEIRIRDLDMWNRGTDLDRSHCNLKVFNWLNSLRETEFDLSLPEGVQDEPPGGDVTTRDEVVVAVDEPKIKPLFERLKKERYIV